MGLKPPLNAQFPKGKYAASSVEIMTKAPATWTIHSDPEVEGWLQEIMKQHPLVARHKLLRLALKHGLRTAAYDPAIVLAEHERFSKWRAGQPQCPKCDHDLEGSFPQGTKQSSVFFWGTTATVRCPECECSVKLSVEGGTEVVYDPRWDDP
jgi:hypothetical protein